MDSLLIIGAGAAGSVVAKKAGMNRDVFKRIHLASRRIESCRVVQAAARTPIDISQVDADDVAMPGVERQQQAGADANFQYLLPRIGRQLRHGGFATVLKNTPENTVVDACVS